MASLQTQYMGLDLNNPIIASSSGITGSVRGVRSCVDAGAGAVVLKSMFEELIIGQSDNLDREIIQSEHPEAYEYIRAQLGMQLGPRPYLKFIEDVKSQVSVPVIASVNCSTPKWWISYAKNIESSGADGLELNISHFPQSTDEDSCDIESRYVDIVHEVTSQISIPVAVKLGYYFTSLGNIMEDIVEAGAKALVLFNRYYTVDIDIEKKRFVNAVTFSSPEEMSMPLRWTGILSGRLGCDISASTGIHDSEGILKMLLAGASTVQLCSALYQNGPGYIAELIEDLDKWLEKQCVSSVNGIRGLARQQDAAGGELLKRIQYLKSLEEAAKYEY
ncbi:MAG: dihydroorotate dehydrogenase-like protein [Candidatus Latescibacteria bacterium]|nr:dihydroorotate dehydrogenase-like protein [Candidatus Latescibacterota bacterium]